MKRRLKLIGQYQPTELLKYAGLLVWLSTVLVVALAPVILGDSPLPASKVLVLWALQIVFGWSYWREVRRLRTPPRPGRPSICLILMTVSALAITWFSRGGGMGGILLMVVGSLLPWLVSIRVGLVWIVLQSVLLSVVMQVNTLIGGLLDGVILAATFMGIALFAFMASLVAMRHAKARDELRKVNSELRATQALLAENTRIAERVRIARELHDLVGHHLTALTLNLEVADHLCTGKAQEHVQQAKAIAKLLLSDVREVVSELRTSDSVDLAAALQALIEGVPQPSIHLDLPERLNVVDPRQAQVLLRCAQELITNAVRHAQASNLWLVLTQSDEGLVLSAHDDGRGSGNAEPGNGLRGMAERLGQLGGRLEVNHENQQGFAVTAVLPNSA
ncbi:MAG: sensor histidine kinase [Wenzhouxiangellaceae bacterium]